MKRIHLFEFSDQSWFPGFLRDYMTDFLQFGANSFDIYRNVVPVIIEGLVRGDTTRIIDLASGGGGGMIKLARHLKKRIKGIQIILTDYYPNKSAFERTTRRFPEVFRFSTTPVDAKSVPQNLTGLRTMFLAFHHFKPEDASKILTNAISASMPIAIFEVQQRNVRSMIPMIISPANVLLTTPFIKPFRLGRLLFTYLIPIVPLVTMFDGIVSVLRTYSQKELKIMIRDLPDSEKYEWKMGTVKAGKTNPATVFYLLGYPK